MVMSMDSSLKNDVYVVTGASSFIGAGLIEHLVQEKKTVYAVCRKKTQNQYRLLKSEFLTVIDCDLEQMANLPLLIQNSCDVFYHLAWSTSSKDDLYLQTQNIQYTLDAVHAAKKLGCHTFLGAGSQAEYGLANVKLDENTPAFPVTGYGMAKLCAGQMSRKLCEELGIKHIWARILSVYGKNDNPNTLISYLISCFEKGETPLLTDCEQTWDYLHIDDCAEILYKLSFFGENGKTYVMGSGCAMQLKECVNIVRACFTNSTQVHFKAIDRPLNTPGYLLAKSGYCGGLVQNPKQFSHATIQKLLQDQTE